MQQLIVTLIVLFAVGAVARRIAPPAWKAACSGFAARNARRFGWHAWADRLMAQKPETPGCASGCSTCSGCDLAPGRTAKAAAKTPAGEYIVVIERLKKAQ